MSCKANLVIQPSPEGIPCSLCKMRVARHWRRLTIFGAVNLCSECLVEYGKQIQIAIDKTNSESRINKSAEDAA